MPFEPEEDLRAVLTDVIYQEGAEHGPYELSKGSSHRVRQIGMDRSVVPLLVWASVSMEETEVLIGSIIDILY
jgi:hypothetical protein